MKIAKLKVQDQKLDNVLFEAQLEYKINSALNSYLQSIDQLNTYTTLVKNYEALYEAEKSLFDAGESSVFMINSREIKLIKTTIELIEAENNVIMLEGQLNYVLILN